MGCNASRVALAHNHVSGVALWSDADLSTTMRIRDVLRETGIELVDHFIIANDDMVSMAESGLSGSSSSRNCHVLVSCPSKLLLACKYRAATAGMSRMSTPPSVHTGHRKRVKDEFLANGLNGLPDHRVRTRPRRDPWPPCG